MPTCGVAGYTQRDSHRSAQELDGARWCDKAVGLTPTMWARGQPSGKGHGKLVLEHVKNQLGWGMVPCLPYMIKEGEGNENNT